MMPKMLCASVGFNYGGHQNYITRMLYDSGSDALGQECAVNSAPNATSVSLLATAGLVCNPVNLLTRSQRHCLMILANIGGID